jgi:hypothetical protein
MSEQRPRLTPEQAQRIRDRMNEILNPAIPEEDCFIPPVPLLTAATAAWARARGIKPPWKQYGGEA